MLAAKSKTNNAHLEKIVDSSIFNSGKYEILQQLHEEQIEFRVMTQLKNELFDSNLLKDNYLVPVEEYNRILKASTKDRLVNIAPKLFNELKTSDGMVNLQKLMDLLDLYTLLPMKKNIVKNQSKSIYQCMSGNTAEGHSIVQRDSAQEGSLKLMMDLLWIKLDERFSSMGQAFRYFDKNYNNRVSFGEFQKALDHLRIKYQVDMIDKIF